MVDKSRFNAQQWEAIVAPTDEDILISAGAGSGKTNTLSERVSEILLKDELKPSELLVLTFTNNAAHEMKERILAKFPKEQKQKALELLSSHIQTFDSLYQYLVSLYANELGLSDKLNILDETIARTKRNEIIDDIFLSYYQNPSKIGPLLSFIRKIDMKSDNVAKKNILALWDQLDSLGRKEKESFLADYDERFFSDEFVRSLYHECVALAKEAIKETIYEAAFEEYQYDVCSGKEYTLEKAEASFASLGFWGKNVDAFTFKEETVAMPLYQEILHLLCLPDEEFVEKAWALKEEKPELFAKTIKGLSKEEKPRLEAGWKKLKGIFDKKKNILKWIDGLSSVEEERKKILFYREDIHLLLSFVKEADSRFEEYKKSINSFSFSDIGNYALELLTNPKFEKCADEIRARFSYIMVDEYQDTNPAQEAFLESLLKPNSKGKRAHLFVVGDAKQSIYLFRGSVVALFRDRQKRYLTGAGHKVIAMNYNYRSGKRLLDDINYICSFYMRLNHGSIDYQDDPMEHLLYDDKVDLYKLPYAHFGISRMISPNLPISTKKTSASSRAKKEAFAILSDIKKKINEGYLVYDRKDGIRPCKPSDFAILMRVKKDFRLYERLFTQSGIKLNKVISTNLREANAVILIESLVKMLCYMNERKGGEPKHLFASIARSYAYEYSDTRLYELLRPRKGESDPLSRLKSDPLWIKLEEFEKKNRDSSFHDIFLSLLDEFHVIEYLYKIGDVEDNVSKIESLYQLVLSYESMGGGIHDFVKMFSEMNRYSLEYSADSLTHNEDAVDMMSIHASKGLERKIVYMPVSLNAISSGDDRNKPLFTFSLERGIGFPYLCFDPPKPYSPENHYSVPIDTLLTRDYDSLKNDPNVDDHVRLFYVALTRAENQIIIVGDDDKKKENLYSMLNCCPRFIKLNDTYFQKKIEEGVLKRCDYETFLALGEKTKTIALPLAHDVLANEARRVYERLGEEYYLNGPLSLQKDYLDKFVSLLFDSYRKQLKSLTDLDTMTRIYAAFSFPSVYQKRKLDTFSAFLDYQHELLREKKEENVCISLEKQEMVELEEMGDSYVSEELPNDENTLEKRSDEEWKTRIKDFITHIVEEDYLFFSLKIPKEKLSEDAIKQSMAQEFLPILAKVFDEVNWLAYCSYENGGYRDEITFIDDASLDECASPSLPSFIEPNLDEREFSFPPQVRKRASKVIDLSDEDIPSSMILEKGVHLHRLLELVDIASGDVSFIENIEERKIIQRVLNLPIMRLAKMSEIHSEYQYYDSEAQTTGSIDLLFVHDGNYYIVDYKTSHIDDPAYREQLLAYSNNVSRIFGVSKEKIHLYLISILKGIQKEVTD